MAANSTYANISGLMLFERPRSISKKVTELDICVFIGPTEVNNLLGTVWYFSNDDEEPVKFEAGFYSCQTRVVKMEAGFKVSSENPAQYSFIGDLKAYSGPVDVSMPYRIYVHMLGLVTKSSQDDETFEMEAEQYTLAHADAKKAAEDKAQREGSSVAAAVAAVPRSMFSVSGFFGKSQHYKNKRPVPFANKLTLVGGFLAGTTEELQGTTIKKQFLVKVDEVTFISTAQAARPAPKVTPPITPSASSSGGNRFSSYTRKCQHTEDAAPTSSPSPAT